MAEDSDLERTEQPTPRRLEKAKEEGQVVRSRELATFALLAVSAGLVIGMGSMVFSKMALVLTQGLQFSVSEIRDPAHMLQRMSWGLKEAASLYIPLASLLLAVAIAATVSVGGLIFTLKPIRLDLTRLDPIGGIARLVAPAKWLELLKDIAKMLLFASGTAWLIYEATDSFMAIATTSWPAALSLTGQLFSTSVLLLTGLMLFVTCLDLPLQIWSHHRRLRMSKEEVRQEMKESEGDPHIKAQIRARQREMARRRMMEEVPKADVVIVNPLHYAVALAYKEDSMSAPKVVAKGQRLLAAKIRDLAKDANVPIIEAPPLARALYHHGKLDAEIPARLYAASAIVLAFVYQLKRGQTPDINSMADLPVPVDMDPLSAGVQ